MLRRLFLEGPLNRVALAQLTGLSSGSVTNVTSALLEEGLISEVGLEESDGGRPRVLLQVNPDFGGVIGVEVGETRIRVEGFDLRMGVAGVADVGLHPQHHDAEIVIEEIRRAAAADVAAAVLFFATGPHFITGQILVVDGGYLASGVNQ